MKTLLEIYNGLNENERIKFALKYPRYAVLHKGKEVKKYAFLRQALQFKHKNDSALFNDFFDVVDTWTAEQKT